MEEIRQEQETVLTTEEQTVAPDPMAEIKEELKVIKEQNEALKAELAALRTLPHFSVPSTPPENAGEEMIKGIFRKRRN